LAYLWASDPSASSPLFLAPNPTDFWLGCAGNAALAGWVQDHNELRIGGPNGYGIDIGEAGSFTLRGAAGLGPFVQGWAFKVPLGAYGSMPVYLPDGRHGPGLTLFMWTPKFKITGSSSDGLTFTVNYLLAVRAIVAPRTRVGSTDPNSVWSPPKENSFRGWFDEGGCLVTWQVSGGHEDAAYKYTYSGSGSKTISFLRPDGSVNKAIFNSVASGGTEVVIDVDPAVELTYTATVTDKNAQSTTNTTETLPAWLIEPSPIPVDNTLTLAGGSEVVSDVPTGWTATLTWSATSPTPAFNRDRERR
jgi:hypothetical protein